MLVPKKDRVAVYQHLFKDGVLTAKKAFHAPKHHQLDVKNIYVIKMMQSFKSRGIVEEHFNWQWYYWYLTDKGIAYLREFLHLPEDVVPATLKKPLTTQRPPIGNRRPRDDRGDGDKKDGAARGDFAPRFQGQGGFGRGAAPAYRREQAAPAQQE